MRHKNWMTEGGVCAMVVGTFGMLRFLDRPSAGWDALLPILALAVGGAALYVAGQRQ